MSSSKTANLQLNQWQANDDFLREEFNQDNGKIDAGVGALDAKIDRRAAEVSKENCMVKLMSRDIPVGSKQIDLDLSGIDLTQYASLTLVGRMAVGNLNLLVNRSMDAKKYVTSRWWNADFNLYNNSAGIPVANGGALAQGGCFFRCNIYPGFSAVYFSTDTMYDGIAEQYIGRFLGCAFEAVQTINLMHDTTVPGEKLTLYGLKN